AGRSSAPVSGTALRRPVSGPVAGLSLIVEKLISARASCKTIVRRVHRGGGTRIDRGYETVRVDDRGEGLLLLTLNRPEVANALNTQMGRDLLAFFDAINAAPGNQRCIVVTGAGERAFCAGGDLKERNGMTDEVWQEQHL